MPVESIIIDNKHIEINWEAYAKEILHKDISQVSKKEKKAIKKRSEKPHYASFNVYKHVVGVLNGEELVMKVLKLVDQLEKKGLKFWCL